MIWYLDVIVELGLLLLFWTIACVGSASLTRPMTTAVAATWTGVGGFAAGVASGFAASFRILPAGPIRGISLVLTPLLLALVMELVGRHDVRTRGWHSFLGTWYGGGLFGLTLAAGRVFALRQLGAF